MLVCKCNTLIAVSWYLYKIVTQNKLRTRSNLSYLIWLKHLIRSRAVTNWIFFLRTFFSFMRARSDLPPKISTIAIMFLEPIVNEELEAPQRYRPENLDSLCQATGSALTVCPSSLFIWQFPK